MFRAGNLWRNLTLVFLKNKKMEILLCSLINFLGGASIFMLKVQICSKKTKLRSFKSFPPLQDSSKKRLHAHPPTTPLTPNPTSKKPSFCLYKAQPLTQMIRNLVLIISQPTPFLFFFCTHDRTARPQCSAHLSKKKINDSAVSYAECTVLANLVAH